MQRESKTHHDWLTVVLKYRHDDLKDAIDDEDRAWRMVKLVFNLDWNKLDLSKLAKGIYRYKSAIAVYHGTVIVGWDKTSVMVQVSGRGLTNVESEYAGGVAAFVDCLRNYSGDWHCTRWDLARDLWNFGSLYSPAHVFRERKKGNLVSRVRFFNADIMSGRAQRPDALIGRKRELLLGSTMYLGKNPFQLRIYNKLAERFEKTGVDFGYSSWYRWELQLNGDKAAHYFNEFLKTGVDLCDVWKLVINANFRFVVDHKIEDDEKNHKDRLATAKWWHELTTIDDKWTKAPVKERLQSPQRTEMFYRKTVSKHAAMRLNYLIAGYVKNGIDGQDARQLALTQFAQELSQTLDDNERWVKENKDLYAWQLERPQESNVLGPLDDFDDSDIDGMADEIF